MPTLILDAVLPHQSLTFLQIWRLVKSPEVVAREGKGLTEHRFRLMLRLIALAQVCHGMRGRTVCVCVCGNRWRSARWGCAERMRQASNLGDSCKGPKRLAWWQTQHEVNADWH